MVRASDTGQSCVYTQNPGQREPSLSRRGSLATGLCQPILLGPHSPRAGDQGASVSKTEQPPKVMTGVCLLAAIVWQPHLISLHRPRLLVANGSTCDEPRCKNDRCLVVARRFPDSSQRAIRSVPDTCNLRRSSLTLPPTCSAMLVAHPGSCSVLACSHERVDGLVF